MDLSNKKELPLKLLQEIVAIRTQARKIASENDDIVLYEEGDSQLLRFSDHDKTSSFYLLISDIALKNNSEVWCTLSFKPASVVDSSLFNHDTASKNILYYIKKWIELINGYNQIHLTQEAQIDAAAEKEIYDLFDFVDEDAATTAFDAKQQLLIDNSLADVIEVLESKKDEFEVAEIIEEIKGLKQAIPLTTKKDFGKKISKVLVKVKKKSIRLFKFVMQEFLKEMIKKGIENGFPKMIDYFS